LHFSGNPGITPKLVGYIRERVKAIKDIKKRFMEDFDPVSESLCGAKINVEEEYKKDPVKQLKLETN